MNWQPGDRVMTPFGGIGTVIEESKPVEYHTLVELDDPEKVERLNPRHFLTGSLDPVPEASGAQLSLLV